jgi:hypothetical protein
MLVATKAGVKAAGEMPHSRVSAGATKAIEVVSSPSSSTTRKQTVTVHALLFAAAGPSVCVTLCT